MLKKIISGGQNGADRAGLDAAKICGIKTGGTAVKGWIVQSPDGKDYADPSLQGYGLVECDKPGYPPRTIANVRDSDGTVWFGYSESPGGKLTLGTCKRLAKPFIESPTPEALARWVQEQKIQILNVAGNRISDFNPTIYDDAYNCLIDAFDLLGFMVPGNTVKLKGCDRVYTVLRVYTIPHLDEEWADLQPVNAAHVAHWKTCQLEKVDNVTLA